MFLYSGSKFTRDVDRHNELGLTREVLNSLIN